MDSYRIRWKKSAVKELKKIHKNKIRQLIETVERLSSNPLPTGVKKLSSSEITYRIRVGKYRIIYDIYEEELVIVIVRIRHRKDAYDY
ncbi:MAG: type II toxin-antitoxin system RelE/ParE family toxin [Calditrichaeota bacterium]|nr:type II toxin-antitoxin system RelE/ParE family toxin [Calditrichota bacterium]